MRKEDAERIRRAKFWQALDAFAVSLEPAVQRAFMDAVVQLRATLTEQELEQIIATRDVAGILGRMNLRGVQLALRDSVDKTASWLLDGHLIRVATVRFDVMHPYVIDAMRQFESRAVAILDNSIKGGVVQYLERHIPFGTNPREMARGLRNVIGLPDNLVQAGVNYRRYLVEGDRAALERAIRDKRFDSTILRAIESGNGLSAEKVDQIMERWYARALKYNTENITRTATMDAVNVANHLAWEQMIADGVVSERLLRRWWVIAKDEKVCKICQPVPDMNKDGRGFREFFQTPIGDVLYPALHWSCRCVVWTEQVET